MAPTVGMPCHYGFDFTVTNKRPAFLDSFHPSATLLLSAVGQCSPNEGIWRERKGEDGGIASLDFMTCFREHKAKKMKAVSLLCSFLKCQVSTCWGDAFCASLAAGENNLLTSWQES